MNGLAKLFSQPIKVINLGLPSFAEDLQKQGITVQTVDWRPPAGGSKKIQALLDKVQKSQARFHKA